MIEVDFRKFVNTRDAFTGVLSSPEITFIFLTLLSSKEYEVAKDYLSFIDWTLDYNAVLKQLEKQGWLKITNSGVDMRAKWLAFEPKQTKTKAQITEWIDGFIALFDDADKYTRYNVSANNLDVMKKMSKFVSAYRYKKDTIIKATQLYITEMKLNNYKYMRGILSFISHSEKGSLLAAYCKRIEDGDDNDNQTYTLEKDNVY